MKVLLNVEMVDNVVTGYEIYNDENVFCKRNGQLADVDIAELRYHLSLGHTVTYENDTLSYSELQDKLVHRVNKAKEAWQKAKRLATYDECLKDCILNERPITDVKPELDSRKTVVAELETAYNALQAEYDAQSAVKNREYIKTLCSAVQTDKTALVAIMKDEDDYLDEWLRHHLSLGFDRIFIYDNDSKNPIVCDNERITVLKQCRHPKFSTQQFAYNRWLDEYGAGYKWVMFLDADEFADLGGKTIQAFLKPFDNRYDVGFVNLRWQHYGANGKTAFENSPVRQRFVVRGAFEYPCDFGKGFVRIATVQEIYLHNARMLPGCAHVNADGEPAEFMNHGKERKAKTKADSLGHIKHFYTKSLEEWGSKIRRGSVDAHYRRKYSEFIAHNPDMKELVEPLNLVQKYQEEQL